MEEVQELEQEETIVEPDQPSEDEPFDVHEWAEMYRADTAAQEEHARLAGVPFS